MVFCVYKQMCNCVKDYLFVYVFGIQVLIFITFGIDRLILYLCFIIMSKVISLSA